MALHTIPDLETKMSSQGLLGCFWITKAEQLSTEMNCFLFFLSCSLFPFFYTILYGKGLATFVSALLSLSG